MATMLGRSATTLTAASASIALGAGLLLAPGAAQAASTNYTFAITVDPAVTGADVRINLLTSEGWNYSDASGQTSANGLATVSVNADAQQTPTYTLSVSPPPGSNDDSAPYLESGSVASITRTVSFPTPNVKYIVNGPDGQPVPYTYINIERPRFENGNPAGSTTIYGGTVSTGGGFGVKLEDGSSAINAVPGVGWIASIMPPASTGLAPVTINDTFANHTGSPRVVNLQQANVRALVKGPDGQRYTNANVSLKTLPDPDQWCQSQQIVQRQVASSGAGGADDTFNAYTDASLTPGGYRLVLSPRWDDTSVVETEYTFSLDDTSTSNIRNLAFNSPNVVLTVLGDDSVPLANADVSVNLAQQGGCFNRYDQTGLDGKAYFNLDTTRNYRFEITPPPGSSQLRQSFTVAGSSLVSGQVTLRLLGANITGSVDDSAGSNLAFAKVSFQAYNAEGWLENHLGDVTADSNGNFRFAVNPASVPYGIAVTASDPNGWSRGVATRVTVPQSALPKSGLTIQLNPANFAGTILGTNGSPLVRGWVNGQTADGTQLAGALTNNSGQFAMYVPGTVSETSPLRLGVWLDTEQRYVQRDVTALSTDFSWRIPAVNLQVVVRANNQLASGAQVNLLRFNGAYDEWLDGGQTNGSGVASFAVDDTTVEYVVEVQPGPGQSRFATARVTTTPTDIGNQTGRIVVDLAQPNAEVLVEGPVGPNGSMQPLSGAFVWVQSMNSFEGIGAQTGQDGVARLVLDDTTGLFNFYVSPPYLLQGELTEGRAEAEFESVNGIAKTTVQLRSPNVGLFVRRPGTTDTPLRHAQIEIRNAGDAWGFSWANANQQGTVGLTLENGEYDIVVSPPTWEPGMSGFGAQKYWIGVSDEGVDVRRDGPNGQAAPFVEDFGVFVVEPATATYSGTVKLPTNQAVANSWVEVLREVQAGNETWYEWVQGAGTGRDGTFGLTLADDTYVLIAQPVWGDRTWAPSAPCYLVVQGGVDATSSSGLPSQCTNTLTLRAPNLVFVVRNPNDGSPVVNSWICPINTLTTTCVASGRDGKATFFIDDTPSIPGGAIRLQVEAPWGSTGLAGRTVEIPVANVGSTAWTNGSQSIELASPNVTVRVWRDDTLSGSEASEGWVSIFKDDNTFTWLGGAGVTRQGRALFSLDDTSGSFCVDAWPGWGVRQTYGPIQQCGVSLASGLIDLVFRSANVKTTVVDADGRTNAYGWVEISGANNFRAGSPLDDRGRLATYLADGTYSLTFYPGWQRTGTPTTVSVTVTAGVPNIASQISLGRGNVAGAAMLNGVRTAGIVVIADPVAAGANVVAVSDAGGDFRMSLGAGSYTLTTLTPPGASGTASVSIAEGGTLSGSTLTVGP